MKGYGYAAIQTQLHSVPPTAAAWLISVILAVLSDKVRLRSPFIAFSLALALAGSGILLKVHDNVHLEYGAIFMLAMGTYSSMPILICWYTMNLRTQWQRSVGTAWMIGFGNIGGIVSTFTITASGAPKYHRGYSILLGGVCITVASTAVYFLLVLKENSRRSATQRGYVESGRNLGASEKADSGRYYL